MSTKGEMLGIQRFATNEANLRDCVKAIDAREVTLAIEASGLMRWAARILRPVVSQLVICEPRYNRSISHSPKKSDEFDVKQLCRLLRMGELHEVWLGEDESRDAFRAALGDMLRFRDQHRELQALIKARYQGLGILSVAGNEPFHPQKRERWIEMVPRDLRHGLLLTYDAFDLAYGAWAEQVREVIRLGRTYPEIPLFMEVRASARSAPTASARWSRIPGASTPARNSTASAPWPSPPAAATASPSATSASTAPAAVNSRRSPTMPGGWAAGPTRSAM